MADDWRLSLENHRSTIAIFLDLQKAFDTVDHKILIGKLGLYGFSNTLLALMRNYLEDRHFMVRLGNELSEKVGIQLGVPQGSILGPLLFLIYINDLSWYDLKSKLVLFADDTLIYTSSSQIETAKATVHEDMEKICEWFDFNRLVVNWKKTNGMVINRHAEKPTDFSFFVKGNKVLFVA